MKKSIYMDRGWGILQQEKEGGEALHYLFEKEEGRIIYPFIKRPAGKLNGVQYYDLVTPRGQGGVWIDKAQEGEHKKLVHQFSEAFDEYCARENIIAEYIRFSPWLEQEKWFDDVYDISYYGETYCTDLTTDFFNEAYSSALRQQIRRAIKNNIIIRFTSNPDFIDEFLKLYNKTANHHGFSDYYQLDKKFLQRYFDVYPDKVVFAVALLGEKVISSAMLLMGEDIAHYHFAATDPEHKSIQPNSLLIYEAASYAEAYGKRIFDLGSAKSGSNLETYKKRFTAKIDSLPFYRGTKVRNPAIYEELVKQAGSVKKGYFPAYRK